MNPQPPRGPPPPPRKPAAARPAGSGRNSHVKNLSGELNEAMRPAREEAPVKEMAKLNIKHMATGGIVVQPVLRRPYNHRMIGVTSFTHGMGKQSKMFNDVASPNFAQATFAQGGYFAGADHVLI